MATIIDDAVAAIAWVGDSWSTLHNDDPLANQYYNSTFHTSTANGDYAVIAWSGTDLAVYGARRSNHGIYGIQVDGGTINYYSGYDADATFQQVLYSTSGLSQGDHTLIISNQNAQDIVQYPSLIWLDVDFVAVTGSLMNGAAAATSLFQASASSSTTKTTTTSSLSSLRTTSTFSPSSSSSASSFISTVFTSTPSSFVSTSTGLSSTPSWLLSALAAQSSTVSTLAPSGAQTTSTSLASGVAGGGGGGSGRGSPTSLSVGVYTAISGGTEFQTTSPPITAAASQSATAATAGDFTTTNKEKTTIVVSATIIVIAILVIITIVGTWFWRHRKNQSLNKMYSGEYEEKPNSSTFGQSPFTRLDDARSDDGNAGKGERKVKTLFRGWAGWGRALVGRGSVNRGVEMASINQRQGSIRISETGRVDENSHWGW